MSRKQPLWVSCRCGSYVLVPRLSRGDRFDFLGYHLTRRGLRAAAVTIEQSFAHVRRLYEQGADPIRIGQYVQRWRKWITSGVLPKFSIIPMKNGKVDNELNRSSIDKKRHQVRGVTDYTSLGAQWQLRTDCEIDAGNLRFALVAPLSLRMARYFITGSATSVRMIWIGYRKSHQDEIPHA